MSKRKDTNKTERIDIRTTSEAKSIIRTGATSTQQNISEFMVNSSIQAALSLTHKGQIQNILPENDFFNSLLINPELSNKSKQIMSKELRKYVRHNY